MGNTRYLLYSMKDKLLLKFFGDKLDLTDKLEEAIAFYNAESAQSFRRYNPGLADYVTMGFKDVQPSERLGERDEQTNQTTA